MAPTKGTTKEDVQKQVTDIISKITPFLEASKPVLVEVGNGVAVVYKHVKKFLNTYGPTYIYPYTDIIYSLLLLLCGGEFALTIMAMQAFHIAGSKQITKSFKELQNSYKDTIKAMQSDPSARKLFDADGDGQISFEEVCTVVWKCATAQSDEEKKETAHVASIMFTALDPNPLLDATVGLWAGTAAILATLRSQLARYVSVGASAGERFGSFMRANFEKPLYERFPDHRQWVDFSLRASCSFIGIMISVLLTRMVAAFECSMKGASSLSDRVLCEAQKRGMLTEIPRGTQKAEMVTVGLAAFGLAWQISQGFCSPWFMRLFLSPLLIVEGVLSWVAAV